MFTQLNGQTQAELWHSCSIETLNNNHVGNMKHQHWPVLGLHPQRFEELSAIALSFFLLLFIFFFCFTATVEINCYL